MRHRTVLPTLAAAALAAALAGCSVSVGGSTVSASPSEDAFCSAWIGLQQATDDARQAVNSGNPLDLPQALQSVQSNLSQLQESLPQDAPADVRRTVEDLGSSVADAVANQLTGNREVEGLVADIQAIPQQIGSYAKSVC